MGIVCYNNVQETMMQNRAILFGGCVLLLGLFISCTSQAAKITPELPSHPLIPGPPPPLFGIDLAAYIISENPPALKKKRLSSTLFMSSPITIFGK